MRFSHLQDWLNWLQSLHITAMDLSLERVTEVAKRLKLLKPNATVITVGGTNGKGSCVAGLEAIYLAAGYKVGAFTSPVLFRHNEYVRVQGQDATDEQFCSAFALIDAARGDITLTFFEFNTLAAFIIFNQAQLDIWLLEVGLGGRFDAVNALDADIAVITSIGIDHVDWLGDSREKIAYEKAGIFRPEHPVVCGDFDPPLTLINYAKELNSPLYLQNQQFNFEKKLRGWNWISENKILENLPLPSLALQNMATVLMVVELLQKKLPVSQAVIETALDTVILAGRIQVMPGEITKIFDVSHNPAAAELLAMWLHNNTITGKTRAVFSMLADKDIVQTIWVMQEVIDEWFVAPLSGPRAASQNMLDSCFRKAEIKQNSFPTVEQAYQAALASSVQGDRVVVFGSFHTVAQTQGK